MRIRIEVYNSANPIIEDGSYTVGYIAEGCTEDIIDYCLNFKNGFISPLYQYGIEKSDYMKEGYLITRKIHDLYYDVDDNDNGDVEIAAEIWRVE